MSDPKPALTTHAAAVQPVAPTTIHTSADGLAAGWSAVAVAGGTLPLYYAKPQGPGPFPVVLVVQEIFGVHEHNADVARRLAQRGYLAIAPELYFRLGDAKKAPDLDTLRRDFVAKADDALVLADLDRAVTWGGDHGGDLERLALTGFCWGGRIAWLYAAHQPRLKAAVAWYGRLDGERTALVPRFPSDVAGQPAAPVLGLYGGQDQGIPLAQVETLRAALERGGSPSLIHVYPEAPHAFYADYRPSYRPAAASDGWRRLLAWFTQHGVAARAVA